MQFEMLPFRVGFFFFTDHYFACFIIFFSLSSVEIIYQKAQDDDAEMYGQL
jgi:hypothetical protein